MNIELLKKAIAFQEVDGKFSYRLGENIQVEDIPNEEPERMLTAEVYPDALATCNKWYSEGHRICFFTSRTEAQRAYTEQWLKKHGFNYHSLLMGKPRGGNYHWIDNHIVKATRYKGKFTDLIEKQVAIEVFDDGQHE